MPGIFELHKFVYTNNLPGTDTKNFTESLNPCTDSWAWAIEQYGTKLLGVISWVFGSEYTFTSLLIGNPKRPSKQKKKKKKLREKINNLIQC